MRFLIIFCLFIVSCGPQKEPNQVPDLIKETRPIDNTKKCNLNMNLEELMQLNKYVNVTYNNIALFKNNLDCENNIFNHLYLYSGAVFHSIYGEDLVNKEKELGVEEFTRFISSFVNKKLCTLGQLDLRDLEKIEKCDWL